MTNRLEGESSRYLVQHAKNPVDWHPWGPEALGRAAAEDKPILLSVGYSACHWCHVMARESFEDPGIAALMNRHFVNVKVDREERPDLDGLYMRAVAALTGQGGWPMTVFLTPEGRPFHGGTYFPPAPRHGLPGFPQVLEAVARLWRERREEALRRAGWLDGRARPPDLPPPSRPAPFAELTARAAETLARRCDPLEGGFGDAPKFPSPLPLEFLLRHHHRPGNAQLPQPVELTLRKMARGGIRDPLGGGFFRYATDRRWRVPHFEKMLCDNALLARTYLHAGQVSGDAFHRGIAAETLDFAAAELRHPGGGFFSSLDADSGGREGGFYAGSARGLRAALGPGADDFMRAFGATEEGHWEGTNILRAPDPAGAPQETLAGWERALGTLRAARARRARPAPDDKVLAAWNGMALAAFAEAGRVLRRPDFLGLAMENAAFLRRELWNRGRLARAWKAGRGASGNGFLEDYACLADGLLALYEATFDEAWFGWCVELAESMLERFRDPGGAGFFDTPGDHEPLWRRPRELTDNATPSGNAMAALVLLRLHRLTGEGRYGEIAGEAVSAAAPMIAGCPEAFGGWLSAAQWLAGSPPLFAWAGSGPDGDAGPQPKRPVM